MVAERIRIALIGGIYSNYHALRATLDDIARRGADATYFLGDLGAFGPLPDRIPELLLEKGIPGIQGNYEESLSSNASDCNCGYTDPRDNEYAQISYDYTAANTSDVYKRWMGSLPKQIRIQAGAFQLLLCHGSPRRINEFLWETTSPIAFLERLCRDHDAQIIACTHTGLHWKKELPENRFVVNAGVVGRPANDGQTNVWYTLLTIEGSRFAAEFIPVWYDYARLAGEMRAEALPLEFIAAIESGWWTTCLESLPSKERARGKF